MKICSKCKIMCQKCNQGIGLLREDINILLKAIIYLRGE